MKITLSNIKFAGICEIDEESYRVAKADQSLISLKNAINDEYRKKIAEELSPTTKIGYTTNTNPTMWRYTGTIDTATIRWRDKNNNYECAMLSRNSFIKEKHLSGNWNTFVGYMMLLRSVFGESHKKFADRVLKTAKAIEKG